MTRFMHAAWRVARTAGAFCLVSLLGFGAEKVKGAEESPAPALYLYQRVLDSKGRDTRDLYTGQHYTNEMRMAIPELLPQAESIAGLRFTLRASPNVRVTQEHVMQERPSYGREDIFAGKRLSTNNMVRFGGESVRLLDIPTDAVGVVEGDKVVARYGFDVPAPATYVITDFVVERARVRHPSGNESTPMVKNLQAVAVHAAYQKPVITVSRIEGNDPRYPGALGAEFYFSVRNQRVFLEQSPDLRAWTILYSNQQTCPSFTLKALNTEAEPMQFFRIRSGSAAEQ